MSRLREPAGPGDARAAAPAHAPTRRVFFALWPDAPQREALAHAIRKAVKSCGGRPVPSESLHVTLAFLGSVPEGRVPELGGIARDVAESLPGETGPLRLRFDRLVHWERAQILCALAGAGDATRAEAAAVAEETLAAENVEAGAAKSTAALAAALVERTSGAGFSPDLKPFRAHVTVARKVVHPPPRGERLAVQWDFGAFALIDSRTESSGPVYSVIESYPLVKKEKAHE